MTRDRRLVSPDNALDLYNLNKKSTQFVKNIKIKESTYNIMRDIKTHHNIKCMDDVIVLGLLALAGAD
jgi:hypothetical protein